MRIVVDCDNVTVDFHHAWKQAYTEWFDRVPIPTSVDKWDGITSATHFEGQNEFFAWCEKADVWSQCKWVPGAPGGILQLLDEGHSVRLVTARHTPKARAHASEIAKFLGLPIPTFTEHKWNEKARLYIDDSPHVLQGLTRNGCSSIKFSWPWNRPTPSTFKASNWHEVLEIVRSVAE